MLFNSFLFLFAFLPLTLAAFYATRKWTSARVAVGLLVFASLVFYGYWKPIYLFLLLGSISVNYAFGRVLAVQSPSRKFLVAGVSLNLLLLGYFKYSGFLAGETNVLLGLSLPVPVVALPLAISFFTFQQIAYLVDCYRHAAQEKSFLNYCLFVSFFPQLIAGPIVHHKQIMPQISRMVSDSHLKPRFAAGLTLLSFGLFKKVIIADNFALYSTRFYDDAVSDVLHTGDAWVGALSYHFQIYFDFSGYSDMAIGLAMLFGIILPVNFNSPYQALSIVDFWRRWHMTLSRFLRDYLYITLGGNRRGTVRRYINLLVTMLLGGLWHGAAWTFVVWGGLHGLYLVINHAWSALLERLGCAAVMRNPLYKLVCLLLTTVAVMVAWVYFRAPDFSVANDTILAMTGGGEAGFSDGYRSFLSRAGFADSASLVTGYPLSPVWFMPLVFSVALLFTFTVPNSMEVLGLIAHNGVIRWRPSLIWALLCAAMLCCSIIGMFGSTEFIYFQF
ncbi:MAG: MBOAT family protein [Halioglobus sp.]|nr:MBOAT family protein [Halioglobus sp.]